MGQKFKMRVLIACECSGVIREEMRRVVADAWSCDLKSAEDGSPYHIQGDCFEAAEAGCPTDGKPWDLIIWHPPCTDLSVSGALHFGLKQKDGRQQRAISFFMACARFPVEKNVVENPICIMSTIWREPDQIIQPHEFGDDASKATCLWLRGVRPLLITHREDDFFLPAPPPPRIVNGKKRWANQTDSGQNKLGPSAERAAIRARTYPGIARAMAEQWGNLS